MTTHSHTDQQIIKQCLEGKEKAYEALYNRYSGYIYTTCIRYGIREYEIKDCMQVIFSEVFSALKKFNPKKASFKTWLTQIAINQLLNFLRRKKIRFDELVEDNVALIGDFSSKPGSEMDLKFINKVISMMPAAYLVVFNLYIIEGFSHQEIAEKLGISISQSRVSLHRGREWAKLKLGRYFNEYGKQQSI